ncbi:protein tramtrack, beta isoform-like isoform X7 [Diorhabda carinulata]|uniref:protein tramtrack, beta isoform-like isoform X7 n=1 Tax=Diorhabda sublineata TaxID=1163346 RepID=UPI0024E0BE6B|nr:protein tramtrack, beta isoform-like isoform X7 [Diorhabda sublineata]XP_057667842.1 protein tramtrack, beta isoform-like isoform X7 [Diorhabda carinulata]
MASEQFSLCWDNFHKNMSSGMNSLLENEDLVDVTLAVQGKCLKAHKMVLSVCSPYFKELFKSNPCQHPIVFMKDVSYEALSDLLQFMYQGEVQVSQENLSTFIKTAEALQIKGLTGDGNGSTDNDVTEVPVEKHTPHVEEYKPIPVSRPKKQQLSSAPPTSSPSVKRQRLSSNDAQSIPQTITKVEPVAPSHQSINVSTPEPAAVHFKMEPYDQSQNLLDETGDENFGDDTLDENVGDDTEDYSMMETGTGGPEEEPQAGTSTDGAGEGQVIVYKSFEEGIHSRLVLDGYEYKMNKMGLQRIPWHCVKKRTLSCQAKFTEIDGAFEISAHMRHNHRPTFRGNLDELTVSIVTLKTIDDVNGIGGGYLTNDSSSEDFSEERTFHNRRSKKKRMEILPEINEDESCD